MLTRTITWLLICIVILLCLIAYLLYHVCTNQVTLGNAIYNMNNLLTQINDTIESIENNTMDE
jgi:predicted PurR-regulated permease PerM